MLIPALSLHNRFTQLSVSAVALILIFLYLTPRKLGLHRPFSSSSKSYTFDDTAYVPQITAQPRLDHPIDHLIQRAEDEFDLLLARETRTLSEAAEAYRTRRGRQPPPWFDKWFAYATEQNAIIVEDFWDRIYHDLNPFWGVSPKTMREQANDFLFRISVRNGNATSRSDDMDRVPWGELWSDMIQSVAAYLPDLDIPINVMDESRMVVPWEEIDSYMSKEQAIRRVVPASRLKNTFANDAKQLDLHPPPKFDPEWDSEGPYWQHAVVGCSPDSPARNVYIETDFTLPPKWVTGWPKESYQGYVQNWTFAGSPCDHLELQGLHGSFIEPVSISNTKTFFPLFGGSKLPMNNEILLPPAMYWTDDPFYSGGESHGGPWKEKKDRLVWRGVASGGRNRDNNWTRFQRHRFVSMVNATSVALAAAGSPDASPNFVLPANNSYSLAAEAPGVPESALGDWVSTWSDASMVNMLCFPFVGSKTCPYNDQYFSVTKQSPMKEQYIAKYLPDIDGNSFSGRYRGFLRSTSLPIKATIYQEWHDSRLVPWKHFVPMDHTFIDIYGIMEYFLGNRLLALEGHDAAAEKIATDGKLWAEKTLRKEDMSVYVLRLLLEYARLCDDDREVLGWAESSDV